MSMNVVVFVGDDDFHRIFLYLRDKIGFDYITSGSLNSRTSYQDSPAPLLLYGEHAYMEKALTAYLEAALLVGTIYGYRLTHFDEEVTVKGTMPNPPTDKPVMR